MNKVLKKKIAACKLSSEDRLERRAEARKYFLDDTIWKNYIKTDRLLREVGSYYYEENLIDYHQYFNSIFPLTSYPEGNITEYITNLEGNFWFGKAIEVTALVDIPRCCDEYITIKYSRFSLFGFFHEMGNKTLSESEIPIIIDYHRVPWNIGYIVKELNSFNPELRNKNNSIS